MKTRLFAAVACIATGGCATSLPPQPPSTPGSDRAISTPVSKSAKTAPYEVLGQRYYPITDASGYRERGVASWYGGKFHGRDTANGERYDMYQYTAAHKTLPLPTWVRVTNLRNGSEIIVRVNDRGPFVKNRLIDLSYAAALRIGMVDDGTTLVEVEAIDAPAAATSASVPKLTDPPRPDTPEIPASRPPPDPAQETPEPAEPLRLFVQVGAFGSITNAQRLQTNLYNAGLTDVRLSSGYMQDIPVYRVQIGPLSDVLEYDVLMARLDSLGINDTHLVTE